MGRAWFIGLLAILGIVVAAPSASAHGVLETSRPANREVLIQPPEAVTLRFTEPPELRFSTVQVLDRFGASYVGGGLETSGDNLTLRLRLRPLPKGVYTVNWRIVSSVDGHATAGSFAFGVNEPVTDAATRPAPTSPDRGSILSVSGRFLFYTGLTGLVGTAWVGALAFRRRRRSLKVLLVAAWITAALGLAALTLAQSEVAGSSFGGVFDLPTAGAIAWRGAGILTAAGGLVVAWRGGARRWQLGLGLLASGAAVAVVAHVHSGHAAASSWLRAMVALQAVHFLAAAAWIGGLAALLVGAALRTDVDVDKAAAARRFSTGAAIALGLLATTGIVRAIDEVGGWDPLFDTAYGRLVLTKAALLVVLALLGALNRWRSLPTGSFRGLRRVGTVELAVAAAVFAVTGFLTTSPPPDGSSNTKAPAPPVIVVDGSDYATTMRVRLTASPGQAGQNRFTIRLSDYDTAEAVKADRVTARFRLPAHPETSPTTVELPSTGPGTYVADGGNLTLPGRWLVTVLVERAGESVELPLNLLTRFARPEVKVDRAPGQPSLYTGLLSQERSLQVFVDPERPGPAQLHATFFDPDGGELPMRSAAITTSGPGRAPAAAPAPRRLGPGHFVVEVDATRGPLTVEVTATAPDGEYVFSPVDVTIPEG